MSNYSKTKTKDVILSQTKFNALQQAGQLEEGVVYHIIGTNNENVTDVKLNGTSVVENLVANLTISAATTGTSTTEAKYLTIGNTEYKLAGGGSGSGVSYISPENIISMF